MKNSKRRKKGKESTKRKTINKMAMAIITLNVNRSNFPIKTHRIAVWIFKVRASNRLPTGDSL